MLALLLDQGIGDWVGGCDPQSLEQWLIGKFPEEAIARVLNQEVKDGKRP